MPLQNLRGTRGCENLITELLEPSHREQHLGLVPIGYGDKYSTLGRQRASRSGL
jgi:hypothetical protein